MSSPFFSVIIPTRNRYETLRYAMRTVLDQEFAPFELIISDNSDPACYDRLAEISEYMADERVKYYRTPSVLAMADNWEFALSKAEGAYVIVFGDDDGLVAGSLKRLFEVIRSTKAEVVNWARVEYSWPDRTPKEYSNLMVMPYMARTGIVDGREYTKLVATHRADYRYLPMMYCSAVSRKVLDMLKERTGRIFNASSPDIYTGFAIAYLMKRYLTIGHPMSINGVSARSTGAAHTNDDKALKKDHWQTFGQSDIKWPRLLPEIYSTYVGIIEPFLQLAKLYPELSSYISMKQIYKHIIDHLDFASHEALDEKLEKIRIAAKGDDRLFQWVEEYLANTDHKYVPAPVGGYQDRIGFDGSHLVVDGSAFGIRNVYDASVFVDNIFGGIKDRDYGKPASLPLVRRIKKAGGIILKGM
ncbi:MAG TPA: glycosyltransferase family 2 protein [Puia sp.]|nr:glycosyltransferase family 2 protein [Puia sp.]